MNRHCKIIGIGRNYANHAIELGNSVPNPSSSPIFFLKPSSSIIYSGENIQLPKGCDIHHEVELAVVLNQTVKDLPNSESAAWNVIKGFALAFDLTARNLQNEAKSNRLPWTIAKGFDTFTPISDLIHKSSIPPNLWSKLTLKCFVNERLIQDGSTEGMIYSIPRMLSHVSSVMTLEEGDIILTGTPKGVGPIKSGDTLVGTLDTPNGEVMRITFPVIDKLGNGEYGTQ
jgi:acylpyruvate hydrolase